MLSPYLDYQEATTIKAILRKSGIDPDTGDGKLMENLSTFVNWVRADERAKHKLTPGAEQPPYLLVLLSLMGIHGAAALEPERQPHG
jgi:hypothetical protein